MCHVVWRLDFSQTEFASLFFNFPLECLSIIILMTSQTYWSLDYVGKMFPFAYELSIEGTLKFSTKQHGIIVDQFSSFYECLILILKMFLASVHEIFMTICFLLISADLKRARSTFTDIIRGERRKEKPEDEHSLSFTFYFFRWFFHSMTLKFLIFLSNIKDGKNVEPNRQCIEIFLWGAENRFSVQNCS